MSTLPEKDEASGIETTGHEWDGIKELNNPLPRWWLYVLYASIIWAIGYWIAMPAWPLINSYTKGVLGHSQRVKVAEDLAAAAAQQAGLRDRIASLDVVDVSADPELRTFAVAGGRAAFGDNCAPCHGTGAVGAKGYPNLNDDDWIWGGTLDDVVHTITVGIRSDHEETLDNVMPGFLTDEILEPDQISDVVEYLLDLGGRAQSASAAERGAEVYADTCADCHGASGEGDRTLGSPRLNDAIWLYGGEREDVFESVSRGRAGVMPHWDGRLDPVTIKQLAIYLESLGGVE